MFSREENIVLLGSLSGSFESLSPEKIGLEEEEVNGQNVVS